MSDTWTIYKFYLSCVKVDESIHEVRTFIWFDRTNEYKKYSKLYKIVNRRNKIKKINERYR